MCVCLCLIATVLVLAPFRKLGQRNDVQCSRFSSSFSFAFRGGLIGDDKIRPTSRIKHCIRRFHSFEMTFKQKAKISD